MYLADPPETFRCYAVLRVICRAQPAWCFGSDRIRIIKKKTITLLIVKYRYTI